MNNPNHIDHGHPVRTLLRSAVSQELTTGDLDRLLTGWDTHLPPGQSLSRHRLEVTQAAQRVRALASTGANGQARALADQLAADLAGRMSDAERAVTGDPDPEDVDDIARRMFSN